jgi:hypothetical protein
MEVKFVLCNLGSNYGGATKLNDVLWAGYSVQVEYEPLLIAAGACFQVQAQKRMRGVCVSAFCILIWHAVFVTENAA